MSTTSSPWRISSAFDLESNGKAPWGRSWYEHWRSWSNFCPFLFLSWPHLIGQTKRYFPLISELNQKQFKQWIILQNNLRFVLSWFISRLSCYFKNFGFLRKAAEWKNDSVCPEFFATFLCIWFPRVNTIRDLSLRPVPSCKLFRWLAAGTGRKDQSPRVCWPLPCKHILYFIVLKIKA